MNFFHKAITAVILLLTTPAMSMMPMRDGSTGYPVPVQDHRLWFSCRGVNYENEYLFRVLNHAYGLMSSFATYPVPTERVIYERRGPYYLFPLLQNKQIYDLGTTSGHYLIFNIDKEIMGGFIMIQHSYNPQTTVCVYPNGLSYLPRNW
ncbi:BgtE-5979 [Blumeria graminis f. sp. tritici]|uniref:BgtE-5979 n=1 Tax=Blumeria graminis f. sp. tritici TaxID=62690 RepID=A0A9X9MG73_BLUGR|nr:BgtE-5979 [Blumeria graminis f. sp. tritici]